MDALPFSQLDASVKPLQLQLLDNPQNIAGHLKKRRIELRLKQAEVAKIIGVSEDCITYWENGRSEPQINHYPKIIQFLGYNPFPTDENSLGGKIKKYRFENGLSHKKFGKLVSVDGSTVSCWENSTTVPGKTNMQKLKEFIS